MTPKPIREWDVDEVAIWINSIGLGDKVGVSYFPKKISSFLAFVLMYSLQYLHGLTFGRIVFNFIKISHLKINLLMETSSLPSTMRT